MSVITLPSTARPGLALAANAVAVPALASQVRPALILADRETRALIAAAREYDVSDSGRFAAGPAGIQVWSGPFNGRAGSHGTARHLGSVDWSYDTPVKHYATIYRAMVTAAGVEAGETTTTVLLMILNLAGLTLEGGTQVTLAVPPPRDPFRG